MNQVLKVENLDQRGHGVKQVQVLSDAIKNKHPIILATTTTHNQ
jgi:hypothetical protein